MDANKWAEFLNNLFTAIGIVVGGLWAYFGYMKNRLYAPKIDVKQTVTQRSLGNRKVLFHVDVDISNLGEAMVIFQSGEIRLLQILPLVGEAGESIQNGKDPLKADRYDIDWSLIKGLQLITKENPCEIEPKEKQTFPCDFVIDENIQIVEIYSFFENMTKRGKELGWNCTTIYDIQNEELENKITNSDNEDQTRQVKIKPESVLIQEQVKRKPASTDTVSNNQATQSNQKKTKQG